MLARLSYPLDLTVQSQANYIPTEYGVVFSSHQLFDQPFATPILCNSLTVRSLCPDGFCPTKYAVTRWTKHGSLCLVIPGVDPPLLLIICMDVHSNPGPASFGAVNEHLLNESESPQPQITFRYSRDQLFALSRVNHSSRREILRTLKSHSILRFRGKKSGRRTHNLQAFTPPPQPISVVKSTRRCAEPGSSRPRCPRDKSALINTRALRLQPCLPAVMLFNARSLVNKFSELEASLVCKYNYVHLIAITETWFSVNNPAGACQLPSFRQYHRDR